MPPRPPLPIRSRSTRNGSSITATDAEGKVVFRYTRKDDWKFINYAEPATTSNAGGFWFGFAEMMDGNDPIPVYLVNIKNGQVRVSTGVMPFDGLFSLKIEILNPDTPQARTAFQSVMEFFRDRKP